MNSLHSILQELLGTTIWEAIAVLLAIAYLVLAMRRSLWCWLCGFISSVIFVGLMARSGLVMDTLLQIYYAVMSVYGYLQWRSGRSTDGEVAVVSWAWREHAVAIVFVMVLTAINAWGLQKLAPWFAAVTKDLGMGYIQLVRSPWLDSFITWGSVVATWMVARRILENWLYWIVIDGIAVGLYYSRSLKATAVLFVIYVIMAIYGYFQWRKENVAAGVPA